MDWSPRTLYFGADYNPEQWQRETWPRDIEQMVTLGVNLVSLGVFSWSLIEPREGEYEFEWLDEVVEHLHGGGIRVNMATATASPPAWMTDQYPSVAAVNREGVCLSHGGRQHHSPSSTVYREKSVQLVEQIAARYAEHPALEMWHVNNELGCHTPHCYGEEAAIAFRQWLQDKYTTVGNLNDAWSTRFWSQSYSSFDEINPPRLTPVGTFPNGSQVHDFMHFSSDQLLRQFIAERDAIRRFDSTHPITTNFMSMRHISAMDYWKWAEEVDFVSTDHYAEAENPKAHVELAFAADLTRGLAGGKPWLLMEHSPAAVNWQPRNVPKDSDETIRHAMSHVARGSQGVMFFQFKQSQGGSERFHSAMVPHVGTASRVTRTMEDLGQQLGALADLTSQNPPTAPVGFVLDYHSWWATQQLNLPSVDLNYSELAHSWYDTLHALGIRVDFVNPDASLDQLARYKALVAPMLHVVNDSRAKTLDRYVSEGGHLLTSYFSGVSDESLKVHLGGYGGALVRELCGVWVEEFVPLRANETVMLSNGWTGRYWTERSQSRNADVLCHFPPRGVADGGVAFSRNRRGAGEAWYLGTMLAGDDLVSAVSEYCTAAGIRGEGSADLEVLTRGDYVLLINHQEVTVEHRDQTVSAGGVRWITQ